MYSLLRSLPSLSGAACSTLRVVFLKRAALSNEVSSTGAYGPGLVLLKRQSFSYVVLVGRSRRQARANLSASTGRHTHPRPHRFVDGAVGRSEGRIPAVLVFAVVFIMVVHCGGFRGCWWPDFCLLTRLSSGCLINPSRSSPLQALNAPLPNSIGFVL